MADRDIQDLQYASLLRTTTADTRTGTRSIPFTQEQIRLISQWASNAWHDADQARLLARIDSPQEKAHLADQQFIESIQDKLR